MMRPRRTWARELGQVALLAATLVVAALWLPACGSRAPKVALDAARDRGTPDVYVPPDLGIDSARDTLAPDVHSGPCVAPRPDPVMHYSKIFEGEAIHLFATPEGRTLIVTPYEIASVAATVTQTLTSTKQNVMALYDGKELLVGDDAGRFRVFDDTLTLQRTFFMAANQLCLRPLVLPGGRLLCGDYKLKKFVTYDLATGAAVSQKEVKQLNSPNGTNPLIWIGANHVVTNDGTAAFLYKVEADALQLVCGQPFDSQGGWFIAEDLGDRALVSDGRIVKVFGNSCQWTGGNYFQTVGRFFTPQANGSLHVIDSGGVFAGLATMNGGRVALKIDRDTHQIIGNPTGFSNVGAPFPFAMTYSAACDYLAFAHVDGAKRAVARIYF